MSPRSVALATTCAALLAWVTPGPAAGVDRAPRPARSRDLPPLGDTVVLSWNDLGMHCMNQNHATFSVLPPFNNLYAQVIRRGDADHLPQIVDTGVSVEYSVPGNTYSVGKTDFWTYAPALFGVNLPDNVGLTGRGLTGTLDPGAGHFSAIGIPVTPWPDADLIHENPFQQALVVVRDAGGAELARSTPVIPVSTEIHCVDSGCHSSENAIVNGHPREGGFDPSARPILCARCHASPALGTTGNGEAFYFSFRIHDQHQFLDQQGSTTAICYRCHPGNQSQCLRGTMNVDHGLQCQNCHGNMRNVSRTIEQGRVPWVSEPRCADCHLANYAENPGVLFRNSTGHGGVMCEGCHNSTHADVPTRVPADNANNLALQGYAGSLRECTVCHGVTPSGAGPHGITVTAVADEVLGGAGTLRAFPNPIRSTCAFELPGARLAGGSLIVFDAQGRIVRMLEPSVTGSGLRATWDARRSDGSRVQPGVYFARWQQGSERVATRLTVVP